MTVDNLIYDDIAVKLGWQLCWRFQLLEWSKSLDACNREIAKQQEMNKALEATIVSIIGENKFSRYLMKVFKKKIKRRKKPEAKAGDGMSPI